MTKQVVVFIDYMNTYEGARRAFHGGKNASAWKGQIHPLPFARRLVNGSGSDRVLRQVRIYRGVPSPDRQPEAYGACMRQLERWKAYERVHVFHRALRYPRDWPKQPATEKGIDAALAVDLVRMGVLMRYDVAIVMSADTDLRPAIEAVAALQKAGNQIGIEVAAWKTNRYHQRLSLLGGGAPQWPPCHALDRAAYEAVQDKSKYLEKGGVHRQVEGGGTHEEAQGRRSPSDILFGDLLKVKDEDIDRDPD